MFFVLGACASDDQTDEGTPSAVSPPGTVGAATVGAAAELPVPRTEVAGARWGDLIAVVGGLEADGSASSRLDLYDPASDTWSRGPELPGGLHHTAVVSVGERLYVVGGYAGSAFTSTAGVRSLGRGEETWRAEPTLRRRRGALAAAVVEDRIYAIGGVGDEGVLTSTEVFEPGAEQWVPGPDLITAREHFAATAVGDRIFAIAGRAGGLETNQASVEVLDRDRWAETASLQRSRGGIGAGTVDGLACVAGGEEPTGTIGPVECLVDGAWRVIADLAVPRHGVAVVAFDSRLHVIGGGPEPGLTVSGAHEVLTFVSG